MLSEQRRREIAREYVKEKLLTDSSFELVRRYDSMLNNTARAFTIDPVYSSPNVPKLFIVVGETRSEVLEIVEEENKNNNISFVDIIEYKNRYIGIN